MDESEIWAEIDGFPEYEVSSLGKIWNRKLDKRMATSLTRDGDVKISLQSPEGRRTVSVKYLVANAFVMKPSPVFNAVINLDGDPSNISAMNLEWRPKWFAWQYARQFNTTDRDYFENISVMNELTGARYPSIYECCRTEGILFKDVWRSVCEGTRVFPTEGPYCFCE